MLHSYNITREHLKNKLNRQIHSKILNDPPYKISSKMDNIWMYYSQVIFGHYGFSPSVLRVSHSKIYQLTSYFGNIFSLILDKLS